MRKTITLLAGLAVGLMASTAMGQVQQCDQRDRVLGHLARKYHEVPVAAGVTTSGSIIEVLATDDGLTWTIIVSDPNGTSCLIAAGEGWRTKEWISMDPEA